MEDSAVRIGSWKGAVSQIALGLGGLEGGSRFHREAAGYGISESCAGTINFLDFTDLVVYEPTQLGGAVPSAAAVRKEKARARKGPPWEKIPAAMLERRLVELRALQAAHSCLFSFQYLHLFWGAAEHATRSRLDEAELSSVAWMPLG